MFLHYANIRKFITKNPGIVRVVVIDRFSTPTSIKGYESILFESLPELDITKLGVEIEWVVKAEDKYLEVALASMVARYFLLSLIKSQAER